MQVLIELGLGSLGRVAAEAPHHPLVEQSSTSHPHLGNLGIGHLGRPHLRTASHLGKIQVEQVG